MRIQEATARQLRAAAPSQDDYMDAVDYLYSVGWKFRPDATRTDKPAYSWGWWVKEGHPTKSLPRGNGGDFHLKAWDTLKTYVAT